MPTLVIESLPEQLHARLQKAAVAHHRSLNQETIVLLERALETEIPDLPEPPTDSDSFFARRVLSPGFARLEAMWAFAPKPGDRDITDLISDDRDDR